MNIDTRFPPQPGKMRVPLYPLQAKFNFSHLWKNHSEAKLKAQIAAALKCPKDACILASMGRIILAHFLQWLQIQKGRQLVVAVPAFYCPHTCSAILAAGVRIVFIDIDFDFRITKSGLDFALNSKCDVLIWPDLFVGYNSEPEFLKDSSDILIVRDIAHTFPMAKPVFDTNSDKIVTLISFGPNKPLFGIGGGGLVIYNPSMRNDFLKYLEPRLSPTYDTATFLKRIPEVFRVLLRWYMLQISVALGLLPHLHSDQRELLETTLKNEKKIISECVTPMTSWQAAVASDHWNHMLTVESEHKVRISGLIKVIETKLGVESVQHMSAANYIGTFVIRINKELRYKFSERLAQKGIQTTWYYCPLTQLSIFSGCERQATPITEQLAGEVLVLPSQWPQTENGSSAIIEEAITFAENFL